MTKKDLIRLLGTLPDETPIVIRTGGGRFRHIRTWTDKAHRAGIPICDMYNTKELDGKEDNLIVFVVD